MFREHRESWKRAFRRSASKHDIKLLEPTAQQVVCSEHFVDGCPSDMHPNPELKLGHTYLEAETNVVKVNIDKVAIR